MGVPHYTIDFTGSFKENVVDNFVDEYLSGRTPNPCVRCNSFIKRDTFIEQAENGIIVSSDLNYAIEVTPQLRNDKESSLIYFNNGKALLTTSGGHT